MIKTIFEWLADSNPWLKVVVAIWALAMAAGLGYAYASNKYRAEISDMVADYEQRKAETEKEFRKRERESTERLAQAWASFEQARAESANLRSDVERVRNEAANLRRRLSEAAGSACAFEKEQLAKIKSDIESVFIGSNVANCDNLIELYTPRFEANPDSLQLVQNIVRMLYSTEGCQDNDLFINASVRAHELEPSYTTAHFLYQIYSQQGNVDNAIKYMEEAINYPESDNVTDAQYYLELANFCSKEGQYAKAFNYGIKAADLDQNIAGKAYYLIGTVWGSQSCPGNEIEKRAPYWVAVDYLVKAKNADPSLAEDANKLINSYRSYYPQAAEAFMYNVTEGDSYTVSCGGMRAVTTVKTQQ